MELHGIASIPIYLGFREFVWGLTYHRNTFVPSEEQSFYTWCSQEMAACCGDRLPGGCWPKLLMAFRQGHSQVASLWIDRNTLLLKTGYPSSKMSSQYSPHLRRISRVSASSFCPCHFACSSCPFLKGDSLLVLTVAISTLTKSTLTHPFLEENPIELVMRFHWKKFTAETDVFSEVCQSFWQTSENTGWKLQ